MKLKFNLENMLYFDIEERSLMLKGLLTILLLKKSFFVSDSEGKTVFIDKLVITK
ncbi:MAG: hypothetical protein LC107_01260 [Chitinophagales bacterium]|nr:hypothetical protein [Chitinophagales bacterium]